MGRREGQPYVYDMKRGGENGGTTELPVSDIDIPSCILSTFHAFHSINVVVVVDDDDDDNNNNYYY